MDSNSTEGSLVSEENPANGLSTVASSRQQEENPVIEQSDVANSGQYEVARPFFSYLLGTYLIACGNYNTNPLLHFFSKPEVILNIIKDSFQ